MSLSSGNHASEDDSFPRYWLTDMRNFLDFVESLAVPQDKLRDQIAILSVKRYDINFPFHVIAPLERIEHQFLYEVIIPQNGCSCKRNFSTK